MPSTGPLITLARHEYRAAVRSRVLLGLIAVAVVTAAASVYIGAVDYRSQLADYTAYVNAATANGVGQVAPLPLQPLSLLRGAIEYLEIIGAVIGITIGYLSITRERTSGTLPLLRSRPVSNTQLTTGSALGALAIIATIVAVTATVTILSIGIIANTWVTGEQILKLTLAYLAATIYIATFYCLGVITTARSKFAVNGLLVALGIWLCVVLVLPQIGDTLDPDNQVPGGLFAALTLDKAHEEQILSHFGTYETVRTTIENASFEKHFERFAFAMTDVKDKYRGFTLGQLLDETRVNLIWLAIYPTALVALLYRTTRRQPTFNPGDSP